MVSEKIHSECNSCGRCKNNCVMLSKYNLNPREYFGKVLQTDMPESKDAIIPYSCMVCGLCEQICPKSLNLGEGFMEVRNNIVLKNKGALPLKQLGSVKVHQLLSFSHFFTAIGKGNKK